jgi:hypothetical protein
VPLGQLQVDRVGDQTQMGQRLRNIAKELAACRVDLLRIQADVVGAADQLVDQHARSADAACGEFGVRKPRTADQELALAARHAVVAPVARQEAAAAERLAHGGDGLVQRRLRQCKAQHRRQQHRGIGAADLDTARAEKTVTFRGPRTTKGQLPIRPQGRRGSVFAPFTPPKGETS